MDSCTLAVEAPSPAAALAASTGHLSLNGGGTTGSKGLILLVPLTLGIGKVIFVRGRLHAQHSAASAGLRTSGKTALGAGQVVQPWLSIAAALPHPPHPCPHPLLQLNPRYAPQLEAVLTWPQSIGIVGGRPSSSLYFVGCQVDATAGAADTAAGAAPAAAGHHQPAAAGDLKAQVASSSGGAVDAAAVGAATSSSGGLSGSVIYLDPHQVQEVSSPPSIDSVGHLGWPALLMTQGPAGSKSCCALNAWSSHPFTQAASCIPVLRFCSQLVAHSVQAGYNTCPCYISCCRPPAATRTGCRSGARRRAPCQPPPSTLPWRWASTAAAWVRQCCCASACANGLAVAALRFGCWDPWYCAALHGLHPPTPVPLVTRRRVSRLVWPPGSAGAAVEWCTPGVRHHRRGGRSCSSLRLPASLRWAGKFAGRQAGRRAA